MDVKPNVEISANTEYAEALIPLNIYQTKLNLKQKMCCIIKRTVDIMAGLVGLIIMLPLTIIIYILHKLTEDERTIILQSLQNREERQTIQNVQIQNNDSKCRQRARKILIRK